MTRAPRPLTALVAVALTGLLGAGCGANAPSETGTATSSKKATKNATAQDKLVKFAECIRAHDVPDFPDANAKGEFEFGVNVTAAVWTKAVQACKDLQPPGSLSSKRSLKEQTASLRFAECVRENGVKDFPDPVNGEPLINTYLIPSSDKPGGMKALDAAIHACKTVLAEAAAGQ
jgi:hypothetical protein